jgi:integrase
MAGAIRTAVFSRTGYSATGAASVAAELLSVHCWGERTWITRASQWRKWETFCEEDGRSSFPATEGDVLAYVGYLKMEQSIAASSLPQYLSAISRYHELAGLPSPTRTPMVKALVGAYERSLDIPDDARLVRVGLPAADVRRVLHLGLSTAAPAVVRDCALVIMLFLTGCRGSTAVRLGPSDVGLADGTVTVRLVHRKGKRTRNPLVLTYPQNTDGEAEGKSPYLLFHRWDAMRLTSDEYFALVEEEHLSTVTVAQALASALIAAGVTVPAGCTYSAHSIRIGTFNELLNLQFPTPWIMHHMGWESEGMLRVYYDSRMRVTADSNYFFGHLRAQISGAGPGPTVPGPS